MEKNLVIVDVQYMFYGFFDESYLTKVKNYIESEKWDKLIVIVNEKEYRDEDDKLEHIPNWLLNKSTHIIKKYVNTNFYGNYLNDLISSGFEEETKNVAWRKGEFLVITTGTAHDFFFIPKELQTLGQKLKHCKLIGGAYDYCLNDVKESLEYMGISVDVEREFTYDMTQWKELSTTEEWVKIT